MERRPERQRTNTELPFNSPSETKESEMSSLCHLHNQQKSIRNDPPRSDIFSSRVNHDALRICEYVDCRNVVIRQIFVTDNLSCRPSSSSRRHTGSTNDNTSVTTHSAASTTTSWIEQNKICPLETDIKTDKNLLNEQTIKSEPCSYMPQMQPPSNNTHLPKTTKLHMLPSSNRNELKNINSETIKNDMSRNNDNDFFERLCPYITSWMPFKNNESYAGANTIDHSYHLDLWPSVMNLTSMKMSATTKSYLMLLVLLLISNMAGKKFIILFFI